jgi:putative two-component system response regulator
MLAVVGAATTSNTSAAQGRIRSIVGEARHLRGSAPDAAVQLARAARLQARAEGLDAAEADAILLLAELAHGDGASDHAFALAAEAVSIADRNVGDPDIAPTLAWSLHLLGTIHWEASNYPSALAMCFRALDVYRTTGLDVDEARLLHTIASIHQATGDVDRALANYETALAINETFDRPDVDAMLLGNMARLHGRRGAPERAIELGQRALHLARLHAPQLVGGLLADQAEWHVAVGERATAERCLADARVEWRQRMIDGAPASTFEQLSILVAEGRVALRLGNYDEAWAALVPALDLADRTDHRDLELEIHDLLATAYRQVGRFEDALLHRERHFALHREIHSDATDLRIRTLQLAHDDQAARLRREMVRVRTSELVSSFAARRVDVDAYHLEAFERIASLAELRGGNTTRHTDGVGDLAAEIAHAIGRPPEWAERLRLAARLHDIGKVTIPDSVLLKPGPLTMSEYDEVKQHTVLGRRLLLGVSTELFSLAAEAAWTHHEWWDGAGYPNGLSGEAIPLSGRIVAIADVFDSLINRRIYKREWSVAEAMRFVRTGSGTQFQPELIEAFTQVLLARHPELPPP